jgi:hypothetical protein
MKSLPTLLKLARRDLDILRRALADQIAKRAAIEERIATHTQTIAAEQTARAPMAASPRSRCQAGARWRRKPPRSIRKANASAH